MKKTSSITKKAAASHQRAFEEIVDLIEQSHLQAVKAVNTTLIDLYWNAGKYISSKIQSEGWGKGTVLSLAAFVQKKQPGIRVFPLRTSGGYANFLKHTLTSQFSHCW